MTLFKLVTPIPLSPLSKGRDVLQPIPVFSGHSAAYQNCVQMPLANRNVFLSGLV